MITKSILMLTAIMAARASATSSTNSYWLCPTKSCNYMNLNSLTSYALRWRTTGERRCNKCTRYGTPGCLFQFDEKVWLCTSYVQTRRRTMIPCHTRNVKDAPRCKECNATNPDPQLRHDIPVAQPVADRHRMQRRDALQNKLKQMGSFLNNVRNPGSAAAAQPPRPPAQVPEASYSVADAIPSDPAAALLGPPRRVGPQLMLSHGRQSGLPDGWERNYDNNSGKYYYVDHNTKTTHWDYPHPARYTVPADVAPNRPVIQPGFSLSNIDFAEKDQENRPPNQPKLRFTNLESSQTRLEGQVAGHRQPGRPAGFAQLSCPKCVGECQCGRPSTI